MNYAAMMPFADGTLFAAGLAGDPTTGQLLEFVLKGIATVLFTLTFLAGSCSAVGHLLRVRSDQKIVPTRHSPQQTDLPTEVEGFEELNDELLAVIGAAVAEAIDGPHRVIHIGGLVAEDQAWSQEGRFQHHTSHTILHRDSR